jgi:uncharacterized membrane protein YfcA
VAEQLIAYLPLIAVTFLLAGTVKGVVGLGLPTISVGLLGLVMPPMQAAALLIVPSMVTNIWQLAAGSSPLAMLRRLWPMLTGICVGTWAMAWLVNAAELPEATSILGIALVAYALLGLASVRFSVAPTNEGWLGPVIGAVTGALTALTGVFVIPAVPYLQAIGLDKEELVQALGLSFTVSTLALAATLAHAQAFPAALAAASLLALLPAVLGMVAGQWARARLREDTFRRVFFAGLLALGAYLMLRALR